MRDSATSRNGPIPGTPSESKTSIEVTQRIEQAFSLVLPHERVNPERAEVALGEQSVRDEPRRLLQHLTVLRDRRRCRVEKLHANRSPVPVANELARLTEEDRLRVDPTVEGKLACDVHPRLEEHAATAERVVDPAMIL